MIEYGETNSSSAPWNGTCPFGSPARSGGTLPSAYLPNWRYSSGIDGFSVRYWAGIIWSVSMLSPSTYALPRMVACMASLYYVFPALLFETHALANLREKKREYCLIPRDNLG